jgi:hypothetical protein
MKCIITFIYSLAKFINSKVWTKNLMMLKIVSGDLMYLVCVLVQGYLINEIMQGHFFDQDYSTIIPSTASCKIIFPGAKGTTIKTIANCFLTHSRIYRVILYILYNWLATSFFISCGAILYRLIGIIPIFQSLVLQYFVSIHHIQGIPAFPDFKICDSHYFLI